MDKDSLLNTLLNAKIKAKELMPELETKITKPSKLPIVPTVILSGLIIVFVIILFKLFFGNITLLSPKLDDNKAVTVPENLILGNIIQSHDTQVNLDAQNTDSAVYSTSDMTYEELVLFYSDTLARDGWMVEKNFQINERVHHIVSRNDDERVVLQIDILRTAVEDDRFPINSPVNVAILAKTF